MRPRKKIDALRPLLESGKNPPRKNGATREERAEEIGDLRIEMGDWSRDGEAATPPGSCWRGDVRGPVVSIAEAISTTG